ncbi:MAG: flagellar biosynthetic protein FliO [Desulfovibrionaceae bacterium]|nr:flagellar biosynthetic protein FliO [Desulfovibrionaceae bacterium]
MVQDPVVSDLNKDLPVQDKLASVPEKVTKAQFGINELAQDLAQKSTAKDGLTQSIGKPSTPDSVYVPNYSMTSYFQGLGLLFLILALLWFGVRILKRYGRFNFLPRPSNLPKDALQLEAQLPIGPRKGLMVVRFLQKRLLLGVTDQQISLLTWESVDDGKANFEELMAKANEPKDS